MKDKALREGFERLVKILGLPSPVDCRIVGGALYDYEIPTLVDRLKRETSQRIHDYASIAEGQKAVAHSAEAVARDLIDLKEQVWAIMDYLNVVIHEHPEWKSKYKCVKLKAASRATKKGKAK